MFMVYPEAVNRRSASRLSHASIEQKTSYREQGINKDEWRPYCIIRRYLERIRLHEKFA